MSVQGKHFTEAERLHYVRRAKELLKEGLSIGAIAERLGVSRTWFRTNGVMKEPTNKKEAGG